MGNHMYYLLFQVGPLVGIEDEDNKYLKVLKTPFRVGLGGNKARVMSRDRPLLIDARGKCFDPDLEDGTYTIFYKWFMRLSGSSDWGTEMDLLHPNVDRRKRSISSPSLGFLYLSSNTLAGIYEILVRASTATRQAEFIQTLQLVDGQNKLDLDVK